MKDTRWRMLFRLSVVFAVLCIHASFIVAQDVATAKNGNSATEDSAKDLKREIAKLKREVARLKEQLEIAEHNGFYWPGKKAIGSPVALLKSLPRNLELKRNASWSKFDLPDVNEYLNQSKGQSYAARIKIQLTIAESKKRNLYDVTLKFPEWKFRYKGHSFTTRYSNRLFPLKYTCGPDTVKKLKKINLRKPVPVSAIISRASVDRSYFYLSLKDIKLDRIELP